MKIEKCKNNRKYYDRTKKKVDSIKMKMEELLSKNFEKQLPFSFFFDMISVCVVKRYYKFIKMPMLS